ncbi:MAG: class I SAM-dependent methyltransferase [Spirochaetia bacterium]|jgi:23S rRNA G2069 N7-methylase RlmK/C1962 C5-methylase RlmI|nr:class I SAM-dependent methyltransferase [Spirochaetia bacterium]
MNYILKDFGKLLKQNHLSMRRYFTPLGTNSYRVYDKNIVSLSLTVDFYGAFVYILDFREGSESNSPTSEEIIDTVSRMLYVKKEQVVYKNRKTRKGTTQHKKLDDSGDMIQVTENGLSFLVNLHDYIDTGLFLDHRKTREMVRDSASNKKVLNLFAYTGSFSVYAAAGGAESIDTVDLSGNYNRWAEQNLVLNGFINPDYKFHSSDTADFLVNARNNWDRYDIIIVDPPTFSNSRKMDGVFDIQRDYVSLLKVCLDLLNKDGYIIFSTNYTQFHFDPSRFKNMELKNITHTTIDEDFSKKNKPHRCWLIEKK